MAAWAATGLQHVHVVLNTSAGRENPLILLRTVRSTSICALLHAFLLFRLHRAVPGPQTSSAASLRRESLLNVPKAAAATVHNTSPTLFESEHVL